MKKIIFLCLLFVANICAGQTPSIQSFSPLQAKAGDTIKIMGENFSQSIDSLKVNFGIVAGKVISATTTQILAIVPVSASNAPVSVTIRKRTVHSNKDFHPIFPSNRYPLEERSFSPQKVFLRPMIEYIGSNGYDIINAHDLNDDGKPELLISFKDSTNLKILVNSSSNGNLSFSDTLTLPIGLSLSDIQIADLDGDGKPDIIVSNNNEHTITILKNQSTTNKIFFGNKTTITLPFPAYPSIYTKPKIFIRIIDINKDGLLDVFVYFSNHGLGYVLNNNTTTDSISFKNTILEYNFSGSYIRDIIMKDINGDGDPEILCLTGLAASPSVVINQFTKLNGDTLKVTKAYELFMENGSSFLVDNFDADEKPDIISTGGISTQSSKLRLYKNTSSNNQISFIPYASDSTQSDLVIHAADLNGDSKKEIIIKNSKSPYGLRIINNRLSDSSINLFNSIVIPEKNNSYNFLQMSSADLNQDGKIDIIGSNFINDGMALMVLINEQDNFPKIQSFTPSIAGYGDTVTIKGYNFSKAEKVLFKDSSAISFTILSDTLIKAVVGKAEPGYIYVSTKRFKDSIPGFSYKNPLISGFSPLAGNIGDTIVISGNFFDTSIKSTYVHFGAVTGKIISTTENKIVVTVPEGASYGPIYLTTKSKSVFSQKHFTPLFKSKGYNIQRNSFESIWIDPSTNESFTNPLSFDIDGDNKPDIISIVRSSNSIGMYKNESTDKKILFKKVLDIPFDKNILDFKIVDLTYDGKVDIAVIYKNDYNVSVLRNISTVGNFRFENKKDYLVDLDNLFDPNNLFERSLSVGDFNSDGRIDIVVAIGKASRFSILPNSSSDTSISFGKEQRFNLTNFYPNGSSGINIIAVSDINEDGKPDIVMTNAIRMATVLINSTRGNISFQNPISLDGVGPHISLSKRIYITDINGDGKKDIGVITTDNDILMYKNEGLLDSVKFSKYIKITSKKLLAGMIGNINGDTKPDLFISNSESPYSHNIIVNNTNSNIDFSSNTELLLPPNLSFSEYLVQDLNSDGRPEIIGRQNSRILVLKNNIDLIPTIHSYNPKSGGYGDTINISGLNFSGISTIKFKDSSALSFKIISDTLIKAVVGAGQSGTITVGNDYGTDTLGGFVFNHPMITFSPSPSLTFPAIKGKTSKAHPYTVKAKNLQGSIQITAPRFFEVSRSADSGFSQTTTLQPIQGKIDSANIYVRFKTDSSVTAYSDSIQHSTPGLAVTKYALLVNICDSIILFKPYINNISKDSTIFCFKQDTLTLSVTNGSNFNVYKWSTGDTISVSRIANSQNVSIRVGSSIACLSEPSPIVRFVKNTNITPSIGLTNDSVLVSTNAPFYKWYFNNRLMGDSSSSIIAKKVGFYKVETSNDKLCWDASTSYPIISLPRSVSTDTVRIRIFPNPVSGGFFNVVASLDRVTNVIARVTVTDASGLILIQTNKFIFFGREIKIPITLSTYKGTAFVRVEINGDVETKTIILQ